MAGLSSKLLPCVVVVMIIIMFYQLSRTATGPPKPRHPKRDEEDSVAVVLRTCNSSCALPPPTLSSHSPQIDIIISIDRRTLICAPVLMYSIIRHTNRTIFFHILVTELDRATVHKYIECFQLPPHLKEVVTFNSSLLTSVFGPTYARYKSYGARSHAGHMHRDSMYARLLFHRFFPQLSVALYLDADIVVQADIAELWEETSKTSTTYTISAVQRLTKQKARDNYGFYFKPPAQRVFQMRYKKAMDMERPTYVNGVYMVNLDRWRQKEDEINRELSFWMDQNVRFHWWILGTNTLTFLVFYDDAVADVGPEWHTESLGWNHLVTIRETDSAKLIHFNGGNKPWENHGTSKYAIFWMRQKPKPCEVL